jgi:hypothetical protein
MGWRDCRSCCANPRNCRNAEYVGAGSGDDCADSASAGVVASSAAETSTQWVFALAAVCSDAAVGGLAMIDPRTGELWKAKMVTGTSHGSLLL